MEPVGNRSFDALRELQRPFPASTETSKPVTPEQQAAYERYEAEKLAEAEARSRAHFAARLSLALGGDRAVNEYTLDRLTVTDKNRTAVEAVKVFNPKSDNLYLWGPAGSGKSHLATIATRSAYAAGYTVKTVTQMSLSRHLRGAENANQEDSIIQGHADLHVLCIDDLGVGKDTEFSLSMLYEIIQGRYMNAAGGLIITSNLSLDHLAQKLGEDRIPSRLAQMCKVFSLEGEKDYRLIRRAVEAA